MIEIKENINCKNCNYFDMWNDDSWNIDNYHYFCRCPMDIYGKEYACIDGWTDEKENKCEYFVECK